jgi:hypothetical protein
MANWAWPEIIDEDSARSAAHMAGGWAAAVAGITTLLAVIGMVSSFRMVPPTGLIDAALFAVVAWRVWNGSRAWAITGLALYSLEVVINIVTHPPGVGVLTIIVYLALINGIRGTFGLHKFVQINTPQPVALVATAGSQMPTSGTPPPPPPTLPSSPIQ